MNLFTISISDPIHLSTDCNNYVPRLKEQSLNASEVSCKVDARRKTLFEGKTFIFATDGQLQKFGEAIK